MSLRIASGLLALLFLAPASAQDAATAPAPAPELDSADYQAQDAETKRDALWSAIEAEPYQAADLPKGGAVTSALKAVWGRLTLSGTFKDGDDLRDARNKTFHRWGTSVKVRYEPATVGIAGRLSGDQTAPYTGVFASGAVGIARLSLGLGDIDSLWAPGMGLKLFVDGQESVNVHAIPRDAAQESKDFMAPPLATMIDPTPLDGFLKFGSKGANPRLRSVAHVAAVNGDGAAEEEPRAPHHLEFRPGQAIAYTSAPDWGNEDFRASLAKIPAGTLLYEVWAYAAEDDPNPVRIGSVRTESAFVASAFQDRRLHFKHAR
jgi:hypothetical protein